MFESVAEKLKMAVSMTLENPLDEMRSFKSAMHKVRADPPWRDAKQKQADSWNPYSFEGGLVPQPQFLT